MVWLRILLPYPMKVECYKRYCEGIGSIIYTNASHLAENLCVRCGVLNRMPSFHGHEKATFKYPQAWF